MDFTKGFKIIGISIRTTNQNNQAQQDLGQLWQHFFSKQISQSIPNTLSSDVIAIYTDYQSDYTEDYTTIIGMMVSSLDVIPEGCIGREFKSENFMKKLAKGTMPDAVVGTWMDIWKNDATLNRKYNYDFEVYGSNCNNGDQSEVEIYFSCFC
jgi:predicted transcriptional regulator YdeE